MMKGLWLGLVVGITFTCLLGQWVLSAASKETDSPKGISPEIVAEYVHSVVQADRTFYQTEIVDRMQEKGMVSASEHWRADGGLPLPAQFLQESGRLMAKQGKAIRFRLISSWAINKEHRPTTEFERTALTKILGNTVSTLRRLPQCAPEKPKEGFQGRRRDGWDADNHCAPPIGKANRR